MCGTLEGTVDRQVADVQRHGVVLDASYLQRWTAGRGQVDLLVGIREVGARLAVIEGKVAVGRPLSLHDKLLAGCTLFFARGLIVHGAIDVAPVVAAPIVAKPNVLVEDVHEVFGEHLPPVLLHV